MSIPNKGTLFYPFLMGALLLFITLLSGCGGSENSTAEGAPETLQEEAIVATSKISSYVLVASTPVDDTTVQYTYLATFDNDNFPASQVTARITESPDGTVIVDGTLSFDNVDAGGRQVSSKSFILQRDLSKPFHVNDLVWVIEAQREASLSFDAEQYELRMGVGESRDISYQLLAFNPDTVITEVSLREEGGGALQLSSRNSGIIRLNPGSNSFRLSQSVSPLTTGRFELTLTATLPSTGLEQSVRINIIVEADMDGDGVPDEIDLCAYSTLGDSVDNSGCAVTDVVDSSAFRDLQIGEIIFRVQENNLEEQYLNGTLTGLQASGSLLLLTPLGDIVLKEAELVFEYGASGVGGIERLRGTAQVPFPDVGMLADAEVGTPVMADVGLDYGRNLSDLEAPLVDDRQYLFFDFSAGFEATVGPISFEAPGGKAVTFVLDPLDPFFFFTGDLPGLSDIGVEGLGIAMSLQGLIPFAPDTTWGISEGIGSFDANLYLQGVIPFARWPLNLDGSLAVDVDVNDDGQTLFNSFAPDVEYGGNGTLNVGVDFLRFFSFGFELGSASLGIKVTDGEQNAYFSGMLDPDTAFLPQELVPIRPSAAVNMAGLISDDIAKSFLRGEGEFNLDASTLGRLVGINLNNLSTTNATFSADRDGINLTGYTRTSIYPDVGFDGDAQLNANFTGSPTDWRIDITGDMAIANTPISEGRLEVSTAGMLVSGEFVTPLTRIGMRGQIDSSGIEMRGNTGITIPISVVETVVEWVVDAAICGTERVTDAARCGLDTVTSGAICGTQLVTDGAICGVQTVTSAVQCGTRSVTSAAICGSQWVTDIVTCGWSVITGQGGCNVARTCNVANSCSVPSSCNIANTCSIPASCDIPRGCDNSTNITLPKGEFRGDIELLLGNQGIGGEVSGDYCFAGDCTTLSGGRVRAGSSGLEACITIPVGIGEVCAPI